MRDQNHIKADFPIFRHYPDLIFADNASTTQKPNEVIKSISDYYQKYNANIHRAVYDLGVLSDKIYAKTKMQILDFYNLDDKEYKTIYTGGTTDGFNKIALGLEHILKKGDNIIVSEMEHHSNLIPWQELCRRSGAELQLTSIDDKGDLDLEHFASLLNEKTKIVSLVHISNTLGTINDLAKVRDLLENHPGFFLVDGAQSCGLHGKDYRKINADAYVFGAHKMFGPSGIGAILASNRLIDEMRPFQFGGGMVKEVEKTHSSYRDGISKFEAGTPPLAQIAGFKAAVSYLNRLDLEEMRKHTSDMISKFQARLDSEGIRYLGKPNHQSSVISVDFQNIHPHDAATFLNSRNIAVRAGHHCTQLIMKHYKVHSSVRFSFSIYNSSKEIDLIMYAIKEMKKYFG